jgi:hypothetical protein
VSDHKGPINDKVHNLPPRPLKGREAEPLKGGTKPGTGKKGFDDVEQSPGIGR